MPRLQTFHDTAIHVKYSHDSEERLTTGAGMTFVYHKDITVLFYGPVRSGTTGVIHERACSVVLERVNGLRTWNVSLGTPIDDYETDHDVPEEEIPETIRTAVNTFIEAFEK